MNLFKNLKRTYEEEVKNDPKNIVKWNVFYTLKIYKFFIHFLKGIRPVQLTDKEVIILFDDLKKEQSKHQIKDKSIFSQRSISKGSWEKHYNEYPYEFLDYIIFLLGDVIDQAYDNYEFDFDNYELKKIN
tara:strand:+ start:119 stop:508 length:390 start_codon:yes stop_codon:yes gene_type:complete